MQRLMLDIPPEAPLRVLCLGAHSDDIEIGCAGLIMRLLAEHRHFACHWVVLGADDTRRNAEARASAEALLAGVADREIIVSNFRSSFFPYVGTQIKEFIETLKRIPADLILTHARHDLHQDHRLVGELTHNTFRQHLVLEYEIPKYDGDLGAPNLFVDLNREMGIKKVNHLLTHFSSQEDRHWFSEETFWAMLRLRGIESKTTGGYAEAFFCRKAVL